MPSTDLSHAYCPFTCQEHWNPLLITIIFVGTHLLPSYQDQIVMTNQYMGIVVFSRPEVGDNDWCFKNILVKREPWVRRGTRISIKSTWQESQGKRERPNHGSIQTNLLEWTAWSEQANLLNIVRYLVEVQDTSHVGPDCRTGLSRRLAFNHDIWPWDPDRSIIQESWYV